MNLRPDAASMLHLPKVSVVVPCRNEREIIDRCVQSILDSDVDASRLEILVVDGMSQDGTRERLASLQADHPQLRLVDNVEGTIPRAMNLGIAAATGEVVLKMDAHGAYPRDYIRKTVERLLASDVDMVGGVLHATPRNESASAVAVAESLASPWGSFGSKFRVGASAPRLADAAAFGCWRRDLFAKVGGFDERLVRSSDLEFNRRLRRAGGRIMLDPGITARYFPVATLRAFVRKNYEDGFWLVYPYRFVRKLAGLRHAAPAFALLGGLAAFTLSFWFAWAGYALAGAAALYILVTLLVAAKISVRRRRPGLLVTLPLAFVIRHWIYALGEVVGAVRVLFSTGFWSTRANRAPPARDVLR